MVPCLLRELTDAEYLLWLEADESKPPGSSPAPGTVSSSSNIAVGIGNGGAMGVLDVINTALMALRDRYRVYWMIPKVPGAWPPAFHTSLLIPS